jgi:hypothetical protein
MVFVLKFSLHTFLLVFRWGLFGNDGVDCVNRQESYDGKNKSFKKAHK